MRECDSKIENVLKTCMDSLRNKTMCPDYAIILNTMAIADELAQNACEIVGGNINKNGMAELRVNIITALGITYEDAHWDAFRSGGHQPAKRDWLGIACKIVGSCYSLLNKKEKDYEGNKGIFMVTESHRILQFAKRVEQMYSQYFKFIEDKWDSIF